MRALWDSWTDGDDPSTAGGFRLHSPQFRARGRFDVPRPPQGHPIQIQAGDSDGGRGSAAEYADVIFSRHSGVEDGRRFFADVKRRLAVYGRVPIDLKIVPAATVVLGDTPEEAIEHDAWVREQQISPQGADPFHPASACGPRPLWPTTPTVRCPMSSPTLAGSRPSHRAGCATRSDPREVVTRWRALAAPEGLSIRRLVIRVGTRTALVGTPEQVVDAIQLRVHSEAADGYILVPHLTPHGLDDFVDRVVPILQERGRFRGGLRGADVARPPRVAPPRADDRGRVTMSALLP